MFRNLLFSRTFRDHNYSDFFADAIASGPIEPVREVDLEALLQKSYLPEPQGGLDPYFGSILQLTLSPLALQSFLRKEVLPAEERDYYLSKLYQFIYSPLCIAFQLNERETEVKTAVADLLDQIPNEMLPPNTAIDWAQFWWKFYADTRKLSLPLVLDHLRQRVQDLRADAHQTANLGATAKPVRRHGPAPDLENYSKVASVIHEVGGDWKTEAKLPDVCRKLDKVRAPVSREWATWRPPPGTWQQALKFHKERVIKAIEYRLKQALKYQGQAE